MVSKFKTALVLVVIGIISGLSIWGVNELTYRDILDNRQDREEGYYKEIFAIDESIEITFEEDELDNGLIEVEISIKSTKEVVGYIYKGEETNAYGNIVVLVGINTDGVINSAVISSSTNTPTYVKDVRDDNLPNLQDQHVDTVRYDGVTNATFTYGSVKKVVKNAVAYYQENRGDE